MEYKDSQQQVFEDEESKTLPEGYEADYSPVNKEKPFESIENLCSHTNIRKVYRFYKTVGGGFFGIVRLAELISDPQHKYAVKSIAKDNIKKEARLLEYEIKNLKAADHPNIVQLIEVYSDTNYVHLVMELCTGGEFLVKLVKEKVFSEKASAHYLGEILAAVRHLHELGICHRDLKLENFLFRNESPSSEIKLIDFGFSKRFGPGSEQIMHAVLGSPQYVAPEVLQGNYDFECDVWSLGVILHMMLIGHAPFGGEDVDEMKERIIKHKIDFINDEHYSHLSEEGRDLLSKMLTKDPAQRPSIKACQEHPWFSLGANREDSNVDPGVLERLANQKQHLNIFQKEVLQYLVHNLEDDESSHKLLETFKALDKDKSGSLTIKEIQEALAEKHLNLSEKEQKTLYESLDLNHDGVIEYSEFLAAAIDKHKALSESNLLFAFHHFNVDHSGFITLDNLVECFAREGQAISVEQVKTFFDAGDTEHNGKISYEDFKKAMTSLI